MRRWPSTARSVPDAGSDAGRDARSRSSAPTATSPSVYHPDSAGEGALRRFLAIQAAYEQLIDGRGRAAGRRPSAATRPAAAGRALAADASRARGDARGEPGPDAPARTARAVDRAGSGSGPDPAGPTASPGSAWPTGRTAAGAAAADGPDPTVAGGRPAPGSTGTGPAATAPDGRSTMAARSRPRRRSARRATTGADKEPFDPGWDGGDLVRRRQRHVLDDQSEGIRRSAEARPGVPRSRAAGRRRAGLTGAPAEASPAGIRGRPPDATPDDAARAAECAIRLEGRAPAAARAQAARRTRPEPRAAGTIGQPDRGRRPARRRSAHLDGPRPSGGRARDRPWIGVGPAVGLRLDRAGDGRWRSDGRGRPDRDRRRDPARPARTRSPPPTGLRPAIERRAGASGRPRCPVAILLAVLGWTPIGVGRRS